MSRAGSALEPELIGLLVELRHALGRLTENDADSTMTVVRLPKPGPVRDQVLQFLGLPGTPNPGSPRLEASSIPGIWRPTGAPDQLEITSSREGTELTPQEVTRGLARLDAMLTPHLDELLRQREPTIV